MKEENEQPLLVLLREGEPEQSPQSKPRGSPELRPSGLHVRETLGWER